MTNLIHRLFFLVTLGHVVNCFTLPNSAHCCAALQSKLGAKVSYPGSLFYIASVGSYYSQQEDQLVPGCIVKPDNAEDVRVAIQTLADLNIHLKQPCSFAIRSGGHTPYSGAANIDGGITIDMQSLSSIVLNADKTVASIGPGARWAQVYSQLDPMELAVTGGRVAPVGVGGFITGGGMSYFAARYGFAVDNVINFEIVLSSGKIVNANATCNTDLFFALKGGGNNFGVVTRIDIKTFHQGLFWGGQIIYPSSTVRNQIQAFVNLDNDPNYDPYAALIMSFGYSGVARSLVVINALEYGKPVINPPTFQPFTSIQPQISNTMRIADLNSFATEEAAFSPNGQREIFITTTFKSTVSFLNEVFDIFNATIPMIENVAGLIYSLTYQPLPPAITSKSAASGGNPLGLSGSDGPLVLCLLTISWLLETDDAFVNNIAKTFIEDVNNRAIAESLHHPWIYLNYADKHQDVIRGYGPVNKIKLQHASKKYDPIQLFQKSVPGGFKLFP